MGAASAIDAPLNVRTPANTGTASHFFIGFSYGFGVVGVIGLPVVVVPVERTFWASRAGQAGRSPAVA